MNICTLDSFPLVLTTTSTGYFFVYDAAFNHKPPNLIKSISLKKLYINYLCKNFDGISTFFTSFYLLIF